MNWHRHIRCSLRHFHYYAWLSHCILGKQYQHSNEMNAAGEHHDEIEKYIGHCRISVHFLGTVRSRFLPAILSVSSI